MPSSCILCMGWTQSQVEDLKQSFPVIKDNKLAKVIGKSPNALRIKASRLGIKKRITYIRENLKLKPIEEQLVVGGLLGDLSCRITHTSKCARLEGGHSLKQKEYMLWKINLMHRLMFKIRGTEINTYLYQSKSFKALNKYYNLFYRKGFKSITKEILDLLNDFGLFVWYLDDGSYHKRDKTSSLHTNGFSFEEQILIKEWFQQRYDIDPRIYKFRRPKDYPNKIWYYLYFTVNDTKKLISLFQGFNIPDCMKYKFGQMNHTPLLQMRSTN